MDEMVPLKDAFEVLIQALGGLSHPTINDLRVISLFLPGGADIFMDLRPMVVQLPKLLNQNEWAQMESMKPPR